MKKSLTDEVLDELEFTEEEKNLFKKIRRDMNVCKERGLEEKIGIRMKKMIEEVFDK